MTTNALDTGIGYEPIKARITKTSDGFPADLATAREVYGREVMRAPEDGWFWIFATPNSADGIRRRGLRTIGTVTSTWAPPQSEPLVHPDADALEEITPVVGSRAHTEAMIAEGGI